MGGKSIDTLFLVGAGSQENSWDPVITAISSCPIRNIGDIEKVTCSESATSFFATLVNYRRHLHLIADDKSVDDAKREQARRMKPDFAHSHRELKANRR